MSPPPCAPPLSSLVSFTVGGFGAEGVEEARDESAGLGWSSRPPLESELLLIGALATVAVVVVDVAAVVVVDA